MREKIRWISFTGGIIEPASLKNGREKKKPTKKAKSFKEPTMKWAQKSLYDTYKQIEWNFRYSARWSDYQIRELREKQINHRSRRKWSSRILHGPRPCVIPRQRSCKGVISSSHPYLPRCILSSGFNEDMTW